MLTWTGSNENYFARTPHGEYQVHLVDPCVNFGPPEPQLYIARFKNKGATDSQILDKWPLGDLTLERVMNLVYRIVVDAWRQKPCSQARHSWLPQ